MIGSSDHRKRERRKATLNLASDLPMARSPADPIFPLCLCASVVGFSLFAFEQKIAFANSQVSLSLQFAYCFQLLTGYAFGNQKCGLAIVLCVSVGMRKRLSSPPLRELVLCTR